MGAQVFASVIVGLAGSSVLFLPLVLWQYRRYGRFDGLRTLWTVAGFTYATGLVAFTVFPLPTFEPGYCADHATEPLLDPLRFPREVLELLKTQGVAALTGNWVIWEVLLNIVLFIPFGLIVRRVLEWSRSAVFGAAVAVSLLVELTQATGNWGLVPCPYRFADTTDLFTNSAGALLGIGLERLTPRLLSTKAHLLAQRDRARPVTRGRRLFGMILDTWYLTTGAVVGGSVAAALFVAMNGPRDGDLTAAQLIELQRAIFSGAWIAALLAALIPAVVGTGASLGQRTVYLGPVAKHTRKARFLLRAMCVQGAVPTLLYAGLPVALCGPILALAAVVAVAGDPRGISYRVAGLAIGDARLPAPVPDHRCGDSDGH